jgi:hypothetical protein
VKARRIHVPRGRADDLPGRELVEQNLGRGDCHGAAQRHGVPGIDGQIQQDLLDLVNIS